jgi:hypothetical protein
MFILSPLGVKSIPRRIDPFALVSPHEQNPANMLTCLSVKFGLLKLFLKQA